MKHFLACVFMVGCLMVNQVGVADVIHIDPGSTLEPDDGPFGYGGRGVVFRAEEDFSMSSLGMDLNFSGTLDFSVDVYAVSGTSRGALLSQSTFAAQTDDGSAFYTLDHTHSFVQGDTYEIMMRFSDPGVIFPHYEFNNSSLDVGSGFMAGTEMLVLDGSDYDTAFYDNSWLANFQVTTGVPEPGSAGIVALGLAFAAFRRRR